jgi:DNA-directed RNA polymerase specialized sigma24 family protein
MQYDLGRKLLASASDIEVLMQPFMYASANDLETPPELLEAVSHCMSMLSPEDQNVLYEIFYDRVTYEVLADNLNIKAKSHAWRKTRIALGRLKTEMLKHPIFIEINERQNGQPKGTKGNTQ